MHNSIIHSLYALLYHRDGVQCTGGQIIEALLPLVRFWHDDGVRRGWSNGVVLDEIVAEIAAAWLPGDLDVVCAQFQDADVEWQGWHCMVGHTHKTGK